MDIQLNSKLNQIIKAMEKMHNALVTLIASFNSYTDKTDKRVDALEAELKELKNRLTE